MIHLLYYWEGELESFTQHGIDDSGMVPAIGDVILLRESPPDNGDHLISEAVVITRRPHLYLSWIENDHGPPAAPYVEHSETGIALFLQRLKKE